MAVIRWLGSIDAAEALFLTDTTLGENATVVLIGSISKVGAENALGIDFNIGACNFCTGDDGNGNQNAVARMIAVMGTPECVAD